MTTTFLSQARIIEGKLVSTPKPTCISPQGLARVTIRQGLSLLLRQARIITRPSGKHSHLSRYLVGICTQTGVIVEVFLKRVDGLRNRVFQAKVALKQSLIRRLSQSLSSQQRLETLF